MEVVAAPLGLTLEMALQRRCIVQSFATSCNNNDHSGFRRPTTLSSFRGCISLSSRGPKFWTVQAYVIVLASLFVLPSEGNVPYTATAEYTSPALVRTLGWPHQSIGRDRQLHSIQRDGAAQGVEAQQELLAVRQDRRDPLQHFKLYKGGYNLQSKHYLASTLFTGIHGYFLGTIWLLGGVLGAVVLSFKHRNSQKTSMKQRHSIRLSASVIWHSKIKFVPAILTVILVALIISCCGLACVGSQNFHTVAKKVERTLIKEGANNATRMIDNVTNAMGQMQLDIQQYDQKVAQGLANTSLKLNNSSMTLLKTAQNHKRSLDSTLLGLNVGVFVIAMTNSILWILGFVFFLMSSKLRRPFLMTLALLWILTSLNWFSFGVTYSLSNFSSDTCEALKEYENSSKNTTLDNILPCRDLAMGSRMVLMLRAKIFQYIEAENKRIANFADKQRKDKRYMVEDLVTTDVRLCNPFLGPPKYLAREDDCSNKTISISSLPQLLAVFECASENTTKKTSMGCISARQFNAAIAYISAIEKFLGMLPEAQNLTDCSFVMNTFTIILQRYCGPLRHSSKVVWLAMLLLSTLSTFTILLWLLQFWIKQKYNHSFVHWGGTITPHDHTHFIPEFL